jgi:hypothetical protein
MNCKQPGKSSASATSEDGEFDDISEHIKQRLNLSNYHNYVMNDLFPYTVIVWTDPDMAQQYVEIAILFGSMIATDIDAKIIKDGTAVQVHFYFPDVIFLMRTMSSISSMTGLIVSTKEKSVKMFVLWKSSFHLSVIRHASLILLQMNQK